MLAERLEHTLQTVSRRHRTLWPAAEEMRGAVEDWQAKHSRPEMPLRLTTGFLDGSSPVVDIYELKVWLPAHTSEECNF